MKLSQNGLELIERYEGLRLTAYKCVSTETYYTIGYGHYGADVSAGMQITKAQAEEYLKKDVATAENAVARYCTEFTPTQNQYDALVSFTYNCGAGNLKKLLAGRTAAQVAEAMLLYNKSGGKVLAGLTRRRTEERALFINNGSVKEVDNMSVILSNCGHDERGKYSGGQAGDQTGKEYALINWYNRPWKCVVRHPNAAVRAELATVAKAAAKNDLVGYDQGQRGTYWQHLKASNYRPEQITVACEGDCSSTTCANVKAVGYRLGIQALKDVNAGLTTYGMRAALQQAGFMVLTESKYLTSDKYLMAGDILLNDGAHTAIAVTSGSGAAAGTTQQPAQQAGFNKTGTATCTGNGVRIRNGGGTSAGILTSVNKGAKMDVDGTKQNGWHHVRYNGVVGYMHPDYVKVDAAAAASAARSHKVKAGDNLTKIAKQYGTTVDAIVVKNKAKYPKITANYIVVGWVLSV